MSRSHNFLGNSIRSSVRRRHVVIACCSLCLSYFSAQTKSFSDQAPPFETFVVSKPDAPVSQQPAKAPDQGPSDASMRSGKAALKRKETGNVQVVMTLFPGGNGVSSTANGTFGGHQIDAGMQFQNGMRHDLLDLGYLQAARGDSGVRIGQENMNGFSSTQGIRFYAPTSTTGLSVGGGIYQGASEGGSWLPAFDARWQRSKQEQISGLVAADASWRLDQATQVRNMHFATFAESDHSTRRKEAGFSTQVALDPTLSLYQTLSRTTDGHDQTSSFGGTKRVGKQFYSFDNIATIQQGFMLQQRLVGLLLPMDRQLLSLRWQNGNFRETVGAGLRQSETSVLATLVRSLSAQTQVNLSASLYSQSMGGARRVEYSFGGSHVFSRLWRLQADVAKEYNQSQYVLRSTLEYRLSPEWQLRLLTGPTMSWSTAVSKPSAFGIQIVRNFTIASHPAGSIQGTVLLDGQTCSLPLFVDLDGVCSARTDRHGRFRMDQVAPGSHQIQIDLQTLPANFSPQESALQVNVAESTHACIAFHLSEVGQISGAIEVKPDELGNLDPTAGIGVTVTDAQGHATTTDALGRFTLGNLPRGRYLLTLAHETLPPGYEIEGPDSVKIDIAPNTTVPLVRFTIGPKQRDIVFAQATP